MLRVTTKHTPKTPEKQINKNKNKARTKNQVQNHNR